MERLKQRNKHLALVRFFACVYPPMLFKVFWVNEGGAADCALERPLACVRCFDVIV